MKKLLHRATTKIIEVCKLKSIQQFAIFNFPVSIPPAIKMLYIHGTIINNDEIFVFGCLFFGATNNVLCFLNCIG